MPAGPSRKRRVRRGSAVAYLSMVSLMDMFTIVLLFLLQSFSTESETFAVSPKFKLPASTARETFKSRLTVQITSTEIIVDGKKVADIADVPEKGDMLIKPLEQELNALTNRSAFIAEANPSVKLTREVIILGDKGIPFSLLEKVMFTCGQVGYNNIYLAVTSVEA